MSRKRDQAAVLRELLRTLEPNEPANDQEPMSDEEIEELAARQAEEMIRARRK